MKFYSTCSVLLVASLMEIHEQSLIIYLVALFQQMRHDIIQVHFLNKCSYGEDPSPHPFY